MFNETICKPLQVFKFVYVWKSTERGSGFSTDDNTQDRRWARVLSGIGQGVLKFSSQATTTGQRASW